MDDYDLKSLFVAACLGVVVDDKTMSKRATKAERLHMARVAELGCCICGGLAEVHHITTGVGMGQRASNYDTIPLCPVHHRTGGHGIAIHAGKKTWEEKYGAELDFLGVTKKVLNV